MILHEVEEGSLEKYIPLFFAYHYVHYFGGMLQY